MNDPTPQPRPLSLLSVVIPARNEEGCICSTVEHLHLELRLHNVPHEIIVVDDGSTDRTWELLARIKAKLPDLVPVKSEDLHGFGRAVVRGLDQMKGDAVVIMMADESDDCRDVVRYWEELNEGWDCVFGSRFIKGGGVIDYPRIKLSSTAWPILFLRTLFAIRLNDTTNAFKAYREKCWTAAGRCISPHFNLTVELPLKAIVRGLLLDRHSHHLAQPPHRRGEVEDARKWAAATFSSASISGWKNISAAATTGKEARIDLPVCNRAPW